MHLIVRTSALFVPPECRSTECLISVHAAAQMSGHTWTYVGFGFGDEDLTDEGAGAAAEAELVAAAFSDESADPLLT